VFDHIPPHEQKEMLRLVPHKAIMTEDTVRIALYGRPPEIRPAMKPTEARCQMGEWLPEQEDSRTFLMSEESAEIAQLAADLAVVPRGPLDLLR